jgi:carbon storage regulator CsrA
MLVIHRKRPQAIIVGDVVFKILSVKGKSVRVGIDAPQGLPIRRGEQDAYARLLADRDARREDRDRELTGLNLVED